VSFTVTPGSGGAASNVVGMGAGAVTIEASGKQAVVNVAVAFITGRLTEAEVDFENPTQPVPTADFMTLVNTVAAGPPRSDHVRSSAARRASGRHRARLEPAQVWAKRGPLAVVTSQGVGAG
jgi:hypothetical protein